MKCKIIFIDVDGTLLNDKKEITPEVKNALFSAMDRGIKIGIASGRPSYGLNQIVKELELEKRGGYILAFNGAKITNCKTKKVEYSISLKPETVKKIYNLAKSNNLDILTYNDSGILTENDQKQYILVESKINNMPIIKVNNLLEAINEDPNKLLLAEDPKIVAKMEEIFKKEVEGEANVFKSEPYFLEIVPIGVDKALSIKEFIKKIGIEREQAMAFGDGFNDVTMIEYVGMGVAMKNGCKTILEKADYITKYSNNENGIAEFLKENKII